MGNRMDRVVLNRSHHVKAGLFESEAQPTHAGEQVDD